MKNKIIIISVILIALLGIGLFVLLPKTEEKPLEPPKEKEQEEPLKEEQLGLKEIIEKEIIESKGKGLPKYSLYKGGEENIIIAFYSSTRMEESLPPEKRRGPGLLVFKIENDEIKKIWESSEEIFLDIPRIEVRDITGDGNNEILAFWSDGKVEGLDIYSWTGTTFQYITPQEELTSPDGVTRLVPGFGSYDGGIAVKDLDGDKIEEVIIIETKSIGINPETDESIDEYYRKIYKWNTEKKEYYLWKEEKIGEEKPEP